MYVHVVVPTGVGKCEAETGSDTNRGGADSGPEQHRGAGAEDQRPGQPDGGVCTRGGQRSAVINTSDVVKAQCYLFLSSDR